MDYELVDCATNSAGGMIENWLVLILNRCAFDVVELQADQIRLRPLTDRQAGRQAGHQYTSPHTTS
jgi:hypothetical protein